MLIWFLFCVTFTQFCTVHLICFCLLSPSKIWGTRCKCSKNIRAEFTCGQPVPSNRFHLSWVHDNAVSTLESSPPNCCTFCWILHRFCNITIRHVQCTISIHNLPGIAKCYSAVCTRLPGLVTSRWVKLNNCCWWYILSLANAVEKMWYTCTFLTLFFKLLSPHIVTPYGNCNAAIEMFTVMKYKVFCMSHWSWYSFTAHTYISNMR